MNKRGLLTFCIIILFSYVSASQGGAQHLSLQEAVTASASNNDAIKLSELDVQIAKAKFRQAEAIFLPQVDLSYTAAATNDPLNAFGFKLQQRSITEADFNPKVLNKPATTADLSSRVEFRQPLVNVDMMYQRKGVAKQVEMYKLISRRNREYLSFEAENAYQHLEVLYEREKVLQEALEMSRAIYKTSKDYFDQGLVQKSDLLNAELQVMNVETQLSDERSAIQDASDALSLLMGRSTGVLYTVDPLSQNIGLSFDSLQLSDDRADFEALRKGMEGYDMMIWSSRSANIPKLNAFGSYQVNDNSVFGFKANAYLVGIRMTWSIFNGNRTKNAISLQYLEREKLARQLAQQKSEALAKIGVSRRQLLDAALEMKRQKLAIAQASEALRVLTNRYVQGLVKTTDVLMAQTQLSQQKMGYVQAMYEYNLATASLEFLTKGK
jgi:outer membrane protein TolC